ncbi:MAG: D-ribose pyranase [Corynebacterium sp.]|nr:D-ribose pyranase [Corynebacterium sp.]
MKRGGLLNPQLNHAIARLGHTDTFAICDCGLPLPPQAKVIDLTIIHGVPSFEQVATAVLDEVVIERATTATQAPESIMNTLPADIPVTALDHEEFKKQIKDCTFIIRTGSTTPYANVIYHCGVSF